LGWQNPYPQAVSLNAWSALGVIGEIIAWTQPGDWKDDGFAGIYLSCGMKLWRWWESAGDYTDWNSELSAAVVEGEGFLLGAANPQVAQQSLFGLYEVTLNNFVIPTGAFSLKELDLYVDNLDNNNGKTEANFSSLPNDHKVVCPAVALTVFQ
jgi:hypothetical protein